MATRWDECSGGIVHHAPIFFGSAETALLSVLTDVCEVADVAATICEYARQPPPAAAITRALFAHPDAKHVVFSFSDSSARLRALSADLRQGGHIAEVFTGSRHVLRVFNEPANCRGADIKVLLSTTRSTEGVSLQDVQHVHLVDSHPWENRLLVRQTIGHVVRLNSHLGLQPSERGVHVWRYWPEKWREQTHVPLQRRAKIEAAAKRAVRMSVLLAGKVAGAARGEDRGRRQTGRSHVCPVPRLICASRDSHPKLDCRRARICLCPSARSSRCGRRRRAVCCFLLDREEKHAC